jgi:hypothetical protein
MGQQPNQGCFVGSLLNPQDNFIEHQESSACCLRKLGQGNEQEVMAHLFH